MESETHAGCPAYRALLVIVGLSWLQHLTGTQWLGIARLYLQVCYRHTGKYSIKGWHMFKVHVWLL